MSVERELRTVLAQLELCSHVSAVSLDPSSRDSGEGSVGNDRLVAWTDGKTGTGASQGRTVFCVRRSISGSSSPKAAAAGRC